MRTGLVLIAMLLANAAAAQNAAPMVGGKPLVQVRPKSSATKPSPLAARLQACLDIEDESKERLDCYDAVIAPKPIGGNRKAPPARAVTDCRALKEQDERLSCFNSFVNQLPKT